MPATKHPSVLEQIFEALKEKAGEVLVEKIRTIDARKLAAAIDTKKVAGEVIDAVYQDVDREDRKELSPGARAIETQRAAGPYPCDHPGCTFKAATPQGLGGHRRIHEG